MKQAPTITDLPANLSPREVIEVLNRTRSKGDLHEWTGSLPFHLNREPSQIKGSSK